MHNKGQIFSIDALIAVSIFLIMLLIFFFLSNFMNQKVQTTLEQEELEQVTFFMSADLMRFFENASDDSFSTLTQADCRSAGMYAQDMVCYTSLALSNGSVYLSGAYNVSKQQTSVISRMLVRNNQPVLFTVGVQQ